MTNNLTTNLLNSIKDTKKAVKARKRIRRRFLFEAKVREIKRAIRKEIAVEIRAIKILAPIFGGALLALPCLWAVISVMIIMLG